MNDLRKLIPQSQGRLRGQILIITLLVLTILAIIVVGLVGLASRDVVQTVANQEYERLLNIAETNIFRLIDKYGIPETPLSSLLIDYSSACTQQVSGEYTCKFTDESVTTNLEVRNSNEVRDYQLNKDEGLEIVLEGFRGEVILKWQGAAAMEFMLQYEEGARNEVVGDFYDLSSIFTSNGGDPLLGGVNHTFPFQPDTTRGPGWIKFRINSIPDLPLTAKTKSLRITPRQIADAGVLARVDVVGSVGFPEQVREITATSYDTTKNTNVVATSRTVIPLLSQAVSALHFGLGTEGTVAPPAIPTIPSCSLGQYGLDYTEHGFAILAEFLNAARVSYPAITLGPANTNSDVIIMRSSPWPLYSCFDPNGECGGYQQYWSIQNNYWVDELEAASRFVGNKNMVVFLDGDESGLSWGRYLSTLTSAYSLTAVKWSTNWNITTPIAQYLGQVNDLGVYGSGSSFNWTLPNTVSPTAQTFPEYLGLSSLGTSTGTDILFNATGSYPNEAAFRATGRTNTYLGLDKVASRTCQYRYNADIPGYQSGNCAWGIIKFTNGKELHIFSNFASTGTHGLHPSYTTAAQRQQNFDLGVELTRLLMPSICPQ